MVNSCAGKMGHAAAEAVLRAGLELVPYTFCGDDVQVESIDVAGQSVKTVLPHQRTQVSAGTLVRTECNGPAPPRSSTLFNITTSPYPCCPRTVRVPMTTMTPHVAVHLMHSEQQQMQATSARVMSLSNWHHQMQTMADVKYAFEQLVIIDFTLPQAVNSNAAFYCTHQVPFVMGTTGGDREALMNDTRNAQNFAVIAPQMGKQVVAFQAMMEHMATTFPGAFAGYTLSVTESHQKTKVDTSGTAKAVVASLQQLGVKPFDVESIQKVRTEEEQQSRMKVPEEHLDGHAFHTYHLQSPDGTVNFEFQHNVCGRTIYADGTVDAALFLHEAGSMR
jgi:dihydrodipicolinate reductase